MDALGHGITAKINKVGVDPLCLSVGTPSYETFVIHAFAATGTSLTGAYIRLRIFDYYGESYITTKIPIVNDADTTLGTTNGIANAAAVTAALLAVPNLTFKKVLCEPTGVGTNLGHYKSLRGTNDGMSVTCQYNGNPGRMRIPEIAVSAVVTSAFVVTTAQQGKDHDSFTVKSNFIVGSIDQDPTATPAGIATTITLAAGSDNPTTFFAAPRLAKIGPHFVAVTAATATTLTVRYPMWYTVPSKTAIFVTDTATLLTLTDSPVIASATVGSDVITFATGTVLGWNPGDTIFYQNSFFYVQKVWTDTAVNVNLDKPFGGNSNTGAVTDKIFQVVLTDKSKPYQYVSECSGRGMCAYDTGICTCFKGYTNDNCDKQNILAL